MSQWPRLSLRRLRGHSPGSQRIGDSLWEGAAPLLIHTSVWFSSARVPGTRLHTSRLCKPRVHRTDAEVSSSVSFLVVDISEEVVEVNARPSTKWCTSHQRTRGNAIFLLVIPFLKQAT